MSIMNMLKVNPMFIIKVFFLVFKRFISNGIFYDKFPHWLK
jgi:hypothetical protein